MPCNANHANAVVSKRGNGPGDVRPVTVVVAGIIVVKHEIPAADVIDKPVVVVVHKIAIYFIRVGPYVGCNIRMVIIYAGINYGNYYPVTLCCVPGCRRVNRKKPP